MTTPRWAGCLNWTSIPCLPISRQVALAGTPVYPQALGHLEVHLPHVLAHGPVGLASALQRYKVRVAAATGLLPGSVLNQQPDEHRVRRGLWALRQIGCPVAVLTLDHTITPPYIQAKRTTIARLQRLARIAADYDITLAMEALGTPSRHAPWQGSGPAPGFRTLLQTADLLNRLDSRTPLVGVCVDSVSWAATGSHPEHITVLGHPVCHVRVADIPHRPLSPEHWGPPQRLMPGEGALNWPVFTGALAHMGYTGPLSLAVSNPRIRDLPGIDIAARSATAARRLRSIAGARASVPIRRAA